MQTPSPPPPRSRRGRPAVHVDDAARSAAYRDRRADKLAAGEMALTVLARPTPKVLELLVRRMMKTADDPEALATAIRMAIEEGIAADIATASDSGFGPSESDRGLL